MPSAARSAVEPAGDSRAGDDEPYPFHGKPGHLREAESNQLSFQVEDRGPAVPLIHGGIDLK